MDHVPFIIPRIRYDLDDIFVCFPFCSVDIAESRTVYLYLQSKHF